MLMYYLVGKVLNQVQKNLIKSTLETVLLHVVSGVRAEEIFNIVNLCAAEVDNNNIQI